MDKARLREFRDFFAGLDPVRFEMSRWREHGEPNADETDFTGVVPCGTAACVGGWLNHYFRADIDLSCRAAEAGELIGLTSQQAEHLFFMEAPQTEYNYCDVGHADALAHLDHMLATDAVDWTYVLDRKVERTEAPDA